MSAAELAPPGEIVPRIRSARSHAEPTAQGVCARDPTLNFKVNADSLAHNDKTDSHALEKEPGPCGSKSPTKGTGFDSMDIVERFFLIAIWGGLLLALAVISMLILS